MTVAPLFAQVLPPAPSSARPGQGDSPSDLAGLFALLLAGAPPVQAVVAQGADTGAQAAPGLVAGSGRRFPTSSPSHAVSTPADTRFRRHRTCGADALPPVSPLPAATAAPVPAAFAPASAPQLAPASPDASLPGPGYAPSADLTRTAPQPSLAEPAHALTQTPGAPAPPPLTVAMAPPGTAQTESAPAARPEMTSIALAAEYDGAGGTARLVAPDRRRPRGPSAGRAARCARWRLQAPGRWPRRRPRLVGRTFRSSRRRRLPRSRR